MLKIYSAGSYGHTKDLIKAHRLRTKVFSEIMGWDVDIHEGDIESDQFDRPDTVYVSSHNSNDEILGCCRVLKCNTPFMVKEIWPEYLKTISIPNSSSLAELSRFAVYANNQTRTGTSKIVSKVTAELFYGVTTLCMGLGVSHIYAMHDIRVQRVVRGIGCLPTHLSAYSKIDDIPCSVGCYKTDTAMANNLLSHIGDIPMTIIASDVEGQFQLSDESNALKERYS